MTMKKILKAVTPAKDKMSLDYDKLVNVKRNVDPLIDNDKKNEMLELTAYLHSEKDEKKLIRMIFSTLKTSSYLHKLLNALDLLRIIMGSRRHTFVNLVFKSGIEEKLEILKGKFVNAEVGEKVDEMLELCEKSRYNLRIQS